MSETIFYTDHDGVHRELRGVSTYQDKAGRHWLWCEALKQNLAFREKSYEDMLKSALNSALFILSLKQKELDSLMAFKAKIDDIYYSETDNEEY
jgi:hypothetical protein